MSEDTSTPRSSTSTLISALRIIAGEDYMLPVSGVASAALMEAADRLEEYNAASLIPSNSTGKDMNEYDKQNEPILLASQQLDEATINLRNVEARWGSSRELSDARVRLWVAETSLQNARAELEE